MVWLGVYVLVFRGLAWCICRAIPRSGVVYLPWCSKAWRGVSAVVFRGLAWCCVVCCGQPGLNEDMHCNNSVEMCVF